LVLNYKKISAADTLKIDIMSPGIPGAHLITYLFLIKKLMRVLSLEVLIELMRSY
jgi:hypothetical protein